MLFFTKKWFKTKKRISKNIMLNLQKFFMLILNVQHQIFWNVEILIEIWFVFFFLGLKFCFFFVNLTSTLCSMLILFFNLKMAVFSEIRALRLVSMVFVWHKQVWTAPPRAIVKPGLKWDFIAFSCFKR